MGSLSFQSLINQNGHDVEGEIKTTGKALRSPNFPLNWNGIMNGEGRRKRSGDKFVQSNYIRLAKVID